MRLTLRLVLNKFYWSIFYFFMGLLFGLVVGNIIYRINKNMYKLIMGIWIHRISFGLTFLGDKYYTLWVILNNILVLFLVISATFLLLRGVNILFRDRFSKRPKFVFSLLHMIPSGVLFINGFVISFFSIYVLLNLGYGKFVEILLIMIPNGLTEILALMLACSLGFSYLDVLKPFIMKMMWKECVKNGKRLFNSKTTFYIMILISLLIIFSGFIEGSLESLL